MPQGQSEGNPPNLAAVVQGNGQPTFTEDGILMDDIVSKNWMRSSPFIVFAPNVKALRLNVNRP